MDRCITCLMLSIAGVSSQLSSSPVVVTDTQTASFRWQLPTLTDSSIVSVYVINPAGSGVLLVDLSNNQPQIAPNYTLRVTYTGNMSGSSKVMAFDLSSVVRSDAGNYTCGRNGLTDIIPQCGQKLVVQGQPTKPSVNGPSAPVFGKQVTLSCSANSTTLPADHGLTLTYTWQRDNADITVTLPGSPYTFTVSSRDSHSYRCRARESQGLQSEWSQVYNMEPQYDPYAVTLQPSTLSYTKREGQESVPSILCSATCKPACTYKWFKDGTSHSDGATLTLPEADRSQKGSYKCQASNTHGTVDSSSVSVDVTYVPEVTLSPTCQPHTVYVGQPNVQLICQVTTANPSVTSYIWTHNGSPISSAISREYSLSPVSRNSGGSYTCAGRNSVGTSNVSAVTVEVQYKPSVSVPQSTPVRESQTVNISCSVDANPAATVTWTKKDDSSFTSQPGSTLTISNIQRSQAGTYVCTATNTLSPCVGTALPQSESREMTVDVQYAANITSFSINMQEKTKRVKEHDSVTFRCQVDSNPNSTISLYNGSVKVSSAPSSLVFEYNLTQITCRQRGNYSCRADNNITGLVEKEVEMLVYCSPRYDESYPVQERYASATNSDVSLSIHILSYPSPNFTWSSTNITSQRNLTSSTSLTRISDLTMMSSLTLTNVQQDDFGEYQVYVNNGVGQPVEYSITLDPKGRPSPPTNVTVIPLGTSSLQVSWIKGFNGGDTQTFMVEYSTDDASWSDGGNCVENLDDEAYDATVSNLQPQTVYYVRMFAWSINGKSDYTVSIRGMTEEEKGPSTALIGGATGGSVAALLLLALVAVLFIHYKRKTTDDDSKKMAVADEIRANDKLEMQDNVCYASSDEVMEPGTSGSKGAAVSEVYAEVNKKKLKTNSKPNEQHAEVQKAGNKTVVKQARKRGKGKKTNSKDDKTPLKPQNKQGKKDGKTSTQTRNRKGKQGEAYENTGIGEEGNPYINHGFDDQPETVPVPMGVQSGRDENGLLYVGIDFSNHNPSQHVHREEESTEYAGIQIGVVGPPLTEEEKKEETV